MHDQIKTRPLDYGEFGVWLARKTLRILGWKLEGDHPGVDKSVFVAAPHNSNWDLLFMMLTALSLRIPVYYMMKHTVFFFPLTLLWRFTGGLPVNRSKPAAVVDQMVESFRTREKMFLVITPEGTRKQVQYWKLGFYRIACAANVPISMAYIRYDKKQIGVHGVIEPTGDIETDFEKIRAYYKERAEIDPAYNPKTAPKFNLLEESTSSDSNVE